ncbi:hypothetical protein WA538_003186, partial [Blastocystis sp. DL]
MSIDSGGNANLALILPIYNYDPKTLQLVKKEGVSDVSRIVSRVEMKNGVCTLENGDQGVAANDEVDSLQQVPDFLGRSSSLVNIFAALYENRAFSQIIHNMNGSIFIGEEMTEAVLSKEMQDAIRTSQSGKVVRILPSSASLLENKTNESLISSRMSKQMRSLLKKIAVASIHSSEPIIIKEDGCHVEEEEETSVVPVRRSNWDHVTIWSVDNTCCVVETDYPVVCSETQSPIAISIHNIDQEFTPTETLHLYLNSLIASAKQVLIYNVDQGKPKYVSVLRTEDIPFLARAREPIKCDLLHKQITALISALSRGCSESGTYWVYKERNDMHINVVNLDETETPLLSPEEQLQQKIRFRTIRLDDCHHYASLLSRGDSDANHVTVQYLLLQAVELLEELKDLSRGNPVVHFYERQMIDDFVQLGENSLQLCQKNGRFRDDHFGSFIRTHVQNALDFFHTA